MTLNEACKLLKVRAMVRVMGTSLIAKMTKAMVSPKRLTGLIPMGALMFFKHIGKALNEQLHPNLMVCR